MTITMMTHLLFTNIHTLFLADCVKASQPYIYVFYRHFMYNLIYGAYLLQFALNIVIIHWIIFNQCNQIFHQLLSCILLDEVASMF
jgi:hypothetical protein